MSSHIFNQDKEQDTQTGALLAVIVIVAGYFAVGFVFGYCIALTGIL